MSSGDLRRLSTSTAPNLYVLTPSLFSSVWTAVAGDVAAFFDCVCTDFSGASCGAGATGAGSISAAGGGGGRALPGFWELAGAAARGGRAWAADAQRSTP